MSVLESLSGRPGHLGNLITFYKIFPRKREWWCQPNIRVCVCVSTTTLCLKPSRQRQLIQWKGGLLFSAWKQSGAASDPLYVSSMIGKIYHKTLRCKTQPFLQRCLHPLHLDSKCKAPVAFAAMYLLSHFRAGKSLGGPTGASYLDTKSAYYRVIQEAALGPSGDDVSIAHIMHHFNLDPGETAELYEVVKGGGVMSEEDVPELLTAAIRDRYDHTWFVCPYRIGDQLAATETGSRPGESFADALYAYVYSRVLGKIMMVAAGEQLMNSKAQDVETGVLDDPAKHL